MPDEAQQRVRLAPLGAKMHVRQEDGSIGAHGKLRCSRREAFAAAIAESVAVF